MLNIVIPMAGLGSRFTRVGVEVPKPFIDVHGMPMIELVMGNLRPRAPHRFILVCRREHAESDALRQGVRRCAPGALVIPLDELTAGAACTVLRAAAAIDVPGPLLIANCDQFVEADVDEFLDAGRGLDGLIMTMRGEDPKWSYVACGADGLARRVVEKQVISSLATVGVYLYADGRVFCAAARRMIAREERVRGEFYVAPVYNDMIRAGARVGTWMVGDDGAGMHGLGTPEDLASFLRRPEAATAVARLRHGLARVAS